MAATLHDEVDGEMEVTAVRFEDGILSYEYTASGSQVNWGKGSVGKLSAWLQVRGDTLPRRPEPRCASRGRLRGRGPQENRGSLAPRRKLPAVWTI